MTRIAVLGGTGALGAALVDRLSQAGHEVWVGSRDARKAEASLQGKPRKAFAAGLSAAARGAEIAFLTVPYAAQAETLRHVREDLLGKILVDATVPLRAPNVGRVQLPAAGCAALEAAEILGPEVRVVSALQTIGAEKLAAPGDIIDADVLVAADDAEAAEAICGLLRSIGLRSWHVGPLANAAAAEAMTSVLIQINRRYKLAQSGVKITGDQPRPVLAE